MAEKKTTSKKEGSEIIGGEKKSAVLRSKKRKVLKLVPRGRAYIQATYNNTIITLTDAQGNVISWSSAGKVGFRGPKKSTPFAAGVIARDAVEKAKEFGCNNYQVLDYDARKPLPSQLKGQY